MNLGRTTTNITKSSYMLLKKLMLGAVAMGALFTVTPAQADWHHRDHRTVVVERPVHRHHWYHHRETTIAITGHRHHSVLIER